MTMHRIGGSTERTGERLQPSILSDTSQSPNTLSSRESVDAQGPLGNPRRRVRRGTASAGGGSGEGRTPDSRELCVLRLFFVNVKSLQCKT